MNSKTVASRSSKVRSDSGTNNLGMWIYLMTDCLLFGSFFAAYAVLRKSSFGGATEQELFNVNFVFIETLVLLLSSYCAGMGILSLKSGFKNRASLWFVALFTLGLIFLGMEFFEFRSLVLEGHSWRSSAFLSSYFSLVGLHGLHILSGLIWLAILMIRIKVHGLSTKLINSISVFAMFWHFLDVVWVGIFTVVYLVGVL